MNKKCDAFTHVFDIDALVGAAKIMIWQLPYCIPRWLPYNIYCFTFPILHQLGQKIWCLCPCFLYQWFCWNRQNHDLKTAVLDSKMSDIYCRWITCETSPVSAWWPVHPEYNDDHTRLYFWKQHRSKSQLSLHWHRIIFKRLYGVGSKTVFLGTIQPSKTCHPWHHGSDSSPIQLDTLSVSAILQHWMCALVYSKYRWPLFQRTFGLSLSSATT